MQRVVVGLLGALVIGSPSSGSAQGGPSGPPVRRWEVAAGATWFTSASPDQGAAVLRTRDGSDFALFTTASRVGGGGAVAARAAFALTRRYAAEAHFEFSRPRFETFVTEDVEGAPPITLEERLDRYVIDGALVAVLPELSVGGLMPFVSGGAGYVRQLHEGRTLVEQGIAYHAGGGVKHSFFSRPDRFVTSVGVRGDVRLVVFSIGEETSPHGSFSAALFMTF